MRADKTTTPSSPNRATSADGVRAGRARARARPIAVPTRGTLPFAAQLRARRRQGRRRAGDVLDARTSTVRARMLARRARACRPRRSACSIYEGSGTFGRSCYDDAAQAAAILSQAVGEPVRRAVHALGRARLGQLRPGASGRGARRRRRRRQARRLRVPRLAARLDRRPRRCYDICRCRSRAVERATGSGSITVNPMSTGSMYEIPNRRVVSHAVPMVGYLRGAALRSPLDLSFAFASEQTIDELASCAEDGSARVPAARTSATSAGSASSTPRRRPRSGRRGWRPRRCPTPKSSPAAASGSAPITSPTAPRSPTSRSTSSTGDIVAKQHLRRDRRRAGGQPGAGREPDHRPDGPVGEPRAQGGGDVRRGPASPASTGSRIRSCASPSIPK